MALNTNWFETGKAYISATDGDEVNDGLTQSTPKKLLKQSNLAGITFTTVLRSGVYVLTENLDLSRRLLVGDSGNVRVYCDNITSFTSKGFTKTLYKNLKIYNIDIINNSTTNENTNTIFINSEINGVITFNYVSAGGDNIGDISSNSLITNIATYSYQNVNLINTTSILYFKRCSFINITTFNISSPTNGAANEPTFNYNRCYFQNINLVASQGTNNVGNVVINFNNCAFKDDVNIYGVLISDASRLNTADGVKGTTTVIIDLITINFTNCFWTSNAGFNNETLGDYSLMPSPSQSILYNSGLVIGYKGIEYTFDASHEAFDPLNTGVNIDTGITRDIVAKTFTLTAGTEGTVTSTSDITKCITLPVSLPLTDAIKVFGTFNYKDAFLNAGELVDKAIFVATTNEEVRYVVEIQYLDEGTLQWNGSWIDIELDNILGIETDGTRGNGDPDFDISTGGALVARRFRIRFTLRNNAN
jgi:hypothetical protein